MNKLTAEKCRDRIRELQLAKTFGGISLKEQDYFEALEIALPVLELKEFTPQIDNDGWMEWEGGICPVPVNKWVEFRMRNGLIDSGFADDIRWNIANNTRESSSADVIAYRVIENDGREG